MTIKEVLRYASIHEIANNKELVARILGDFENVYSALYTCDVFDIRTEGRRAAMEYGDAFLSDADMAPLLRALCNARQDMFVSDREVAAIGFALMNAEV